MFHDVFSPRPPHRSPSEEGTGTQAILFGKKCNAKVTGALIISLYNCTHSYHSFMFTSCLLECASVSNDRTRLRKIRLVFEQVVSVSTFLPACQVCIDCPEYCSLVLNHCRFGRACRKISGIQTISFFRRTNITAAVIKLRRLVFRSMATHWTYRREEKEAG